MSKRHLRYEDRTMDVREYESAAQWLHDLSPLLLTAEAENNLPLGLAARAVEQPEEFLGGLRLWGVFDGRIAVGTGLLTRVGLVVSRQPEEALVALAEAVAASGATVPGVVGPDDRAERFASLWSARKSAVPRLHMRQRIHACSAVVWTQRADGAFRAASEQDVELLGDWWVAFGLEAISISSSEDPRAIVRRIIDRQRLFVWTCEDKIVSCAGLTRSTPGGIAVYFVYTPPEQRGRGFATSCVAELTRRMLADDQPGSPPCSPSHPDGGRRFCCLYTDLANPVSNAIYARIGYRPVCDSAWWEFGGDAGG